jgi:type IV secretion system protein TrbG
MRILFESSQVCLGAMVLLAGCTVQPTRSAGPTHFIAAQPVVQPPAVVQAPLRPPVPTQLVRISDDPVPDLTGDAAILRARADSTEIPKLRGYVNAVMVYTFEPGEVYRVDTAPDYVTSIQLEPGEKLISKAAGDTQRWLLGNTIMGAGAAQRVVILLKPLAPDLHTNITITTSKRIYFLDAYSHTGASYQSGISWTYPGDELRAMETQASDITAAQTSDIGSGLSINDLNFSYRLSMEQGTRPAWFPLQVFDDGEKTYIRFPDDLGTTDAPPLFILQQGDRADLVNYRVKGNYYVVDRLFDRAELRFGQTPQTIVLITRTGPSTATTASGRPTPLMLATTPQG